MQKFKVKEGNRVSCESIVNEDVLIAIFLNAIRVPPLLHSIRLEEFVWVKIISESYLLGTITQDNQSSTQHNSLDEIKLRRKAKK